MAKYAGKIYFESSDKARLADRRLRIVVDVNPLEPCDNEDLVFEKAEDETMIPTNALFTWKFDCNHEHEPIWFFTTAERCKEMVSKDPSYWTKEKLQHFAEIEKRLYQDWYDGKVFGFVSEVWNSATRKWDCTAAVYGMYGVDELMENIGDYLTNNDMLVCFNDAGHEELKYEFDNAEMFRNEFC